MKIESFNFEEGFVDLKLKTEEQEVNLQFDEDQKLIIIKLQKSHEDIIIKTDYEKEYYKEIADFCKSKAWQR